MAGTIRARWAELSQDLDDEAGHKNFITMCASNGLLPFAGQAYREILEADPTEDRAEVYRQQVITAALAHAGHLDRQVKTAVKSRMSGLVTLGVGALILLAFAIGYYLISQAQTAWQFNG